MSEYRRRLEVEQIGDVLVINFMDSKILDEENNRLIGEQLLSLAERNDLPKKFDTTR
jgi:anti-sigma B factor antagonist